MYNGANLQTKEPSPCLEQYLTQGLKKEEAVTKTVDDCIKEDILTDYLEAHRAEVIGMITKQYTEEEIHQMFFKNGFDEGHDAGFDEGHDAGFDEGHDAGFDEGTMRKLISQVKKKLALNQSADQISFDLVEDADTISKIIDAIRACPKDASPEEIYDKMKDTAAV